MHEQTLYLQVLRRTPAPFCNPRRALSALESRMALSDWAPAQLGLSVPRPESMEWEGLGPGADHQVVKGLQERAPELVQNLVSAQPSSAPAQCNPEFELSSKQRSTLGREFVDGLATSMKHAAEQQSVALQVCPEPLAAQLSALAADVVHATRALEEQLHQAIELAPEGHCKQQLAMLRASSLMATSASSDLVMIASKPDLLKVCPVIT
jgi:hypothetical protein